MPAASPCLSWDPVLRGHSDGHTAWECDCAFLLLGLPLPHPQTNPCNTPWAEQLHLHRFLIGICNALVFNKPLGCGLGDYLLLLPGNVFTGCSVTLYQRLSWWLQTRKQQPQVLMDNGNGDVGTWDLGHSQKLAPRLREEGPALQ